MNKEEWAVRNAKREMDAMLKERERLMARINWLGVRSTGSERIEKRISELDRFIEGDRIRFKPPDGLVEAQ